MAAIGRSYVLGNYGISVRIWPFGVGEHAGLIVILCGSGDSLRDVEVAGGRIIVNSAKYFGSSVSKHTLLPLLIGGGFFEVSRMQHVPVQAPLPDVVIEMLFRVVFDPLDLSVLPRTMVGASRRSLVGGKAPES